MISELESDINKKDQHNQRNNTEIQRIPLDIDDKSLEAKLIEMLAKVHIVATQSDIADCCRVGKNGSAIVNLSTASSAIRFWKKV